MQKIAQFLLAFFLFCTSVQAFDVDEFAEEFYGDILNKVEVEESVIVAKRVSYQSGLPEELIQMLIKGSVTNEGKRLIEQWCGKGNSININSTCEENLLEQVELELDLAQLETQVGHDIIQDEIWANGTLRDAPFDLVVDLNVIDIILFGKESDIPLARWADDEETALNIPVAQTLSGTNVKLVDYYDQKKINDLYGLMESKVNGSEEPAEGLIAQSQKLVGILQNNNSAQASAFQCLDPIGFQFLNLSDVPEEENQGEGDVSVPGGLDGDEDGENEGEEIPQGEGFDPDPLTQKEVCENPLYGGYYCRNSPLDGGSSSSDGTEDCDPTTGACKKCLFETEDGSISFCITWEFQTSLHSLFSSTWVEDSVQGYIDAAKEVFQNLEGAGPLTPKQEQNQGGFLTHLWDLARPPGQILYTKSKIPEMWLSEPAQKDFSFDSLLSQWQGFQFSIANNYDSEAALFKAQRLGNLSADLARKEVERLNRYRMKEEIDQLAKLQDIEEGNLYYKNVLKNLQNFRKIYDTRIHTAFNDFPFQEIQGLQNPENVCK